MKALKKITNPHSSIWLQCTRLRWIYESTLYSRIYTLYPRIYTIVTNLHYTHESTLYPRIYTISTNLHYTHESTLYPRIYTISTNLHYIHESTLYPRIYTISTNLQFLVHSPNIQTTLLFFQQIAISPTEYFVNVREMWRSDAIEDLAKYGKPVHRGAWVKQFWNCW